MKRAQTDDWHRCYAGREHEVPKRINAPVPVAERRRAIAERRSSAQAPGCRHCGASLSGTQTKFCSPKCCKASFDKHKRNLPTVTKACPECEAEFTATSSPRRKFCSIACTRRARDRIYGGLRRGRYVDGEVVDPIKVFERDGWRCRECRCSTPRKLRGTVDPRAPELDHIVSVADGGEHSWANTQLLCRSCNGRKGRASRGQLVLI